jgi:hypothetical protein
MVVVIDVEPIRERFLTVAPFLDERGRRLVAAAEAFAVGYGGIAAVAMATGMAPSTIGRGLRELAQDEPSGRVRRRGAGRKPTICKDPTLLPDLEALVEPTTRGDPESPLRWTCKSVRRLAQALQAQGHQVSRTLVAELLNAAGYSLQANRKTKEGDSHPDRDAQFSRICYGNPRPVLFSWCRPRSPADFRQSNGREYRPQGNPEAVRVHDFLIKELGRAVPYGVYDLAANSGWVSVGVDHDTAAFAVNSIRQWWLTVGRGRYPEATRLLITADGGGSNGSRVRLWKRELQTLANELDLDIAVSHLPPGTSKWNKIEHRLFSFISQNWRAKPLVSYRVIVELISATTTKTGLTVRCELDPGQYPSGIIVSDAEMAAINIKRPEFHGEWNYTDLRKFPDSSVPSISGHIEGAPYRAGKAGAQATAQSERIRPWLPANRFHAVSQASMMSARLANTELASQWLRR